MRQSTLFTKTLREAPQDEVAQNAILLERGGFAYKNSAGVYTNLPLGWRVIEHINAIVREEMNAIGGQELLMPALVEKRYWEATGRWNVDIGFRAGANKGDEAQFTLGWSHEDILAAMATRYIHSWRDLPVAVYQIQTKFRNEPRAKSGLLRGREFLMKDLYSFHADEKDLFAYYERARKAYDNVFRRCGLTAYFTLAAGGVFTLQHTHEFQVLADVGEDAIFLCASCGYAENAEVATIQQGDVCPKCGGAIEGKRAIEVGNIFPLGTKYAEATGLFFTDKNGGKQPVVMGSYGIGITRLLATIVEVHHDERGIVWPESVAPFAAHLVLIDEAERGRTDALYEALRRAGVTALYDDREGLSAGQRFADADLIGIPYRIVIGSRLAKSNEVGLKRRMETQESPMAADAVVTMLARKDTR